jgi:hypothetical protein
MKIIPHPASRGRLPDPSIAAGMVNAAIPAKSIESGLWDSREVLPTA